MNCTCDILSGGYCKRHDCFKTAHWVQLCRTREDYFRAWEQGRGPGQEQQRPGDPPVERLRRSTEEIAALLVICQACEKFNSVHCTAANGGCQSSRRQCWERWLREKHCPLGKW